MKIVEAESYIPMGRPRFAFYDELTDKVRALKDSEAVFVEYGDIPSFDPANVDTYRTSVVLRQALARRGLPVRIVRKEDGLVVSAQQR